MKAVISVAARMQSTRLPGKVMAEVDIINDHQTIPQMILEVITDRVGIARAEVIVANNGCDPEIREWCERFVVDYVAARVDVMAIHHAAMVHTDADILLLAGADDPFLDHRVFDLVIERMERGDVDYVRTAGWPLGLNVWGMTRKAMEDANRLATAPDERQHVVPFFERRPNTYRQAVLHRAGEDRYNDFRLTVDEPADLELTRAVYAALPWDASAEDVIAFLDAHPEVAAINAAGLHGTAARDAIYADLRPVDGGLIADIRSHVEVSRRAALGAVPEQGAFAEGMAAAMLSFSQWLGYREERR
jgi:spore coat polysaccharide biosynthesis protein SpsF (cytidylyltransferase family)